MPRRERTTPSHRRRRGCCAMTSRPAGGHIVRTEEARSRIRERPRVTNDWRGTTGTLCRKDGFDKGLARPAEALLPSRRFSYEQMKRGLAASAILVDARAWVMAESATDRAVLAIVDRIYDAVERPERWPETIRDLGDLIGGRRDFWGLNPGTRHLVLSRAGFGAGCHGSMFLSRSDLHELDQYAEEFGELIVRFLKIVFLSTLSSQKDIAAREAMGLRMTRRYLQAFRGMPVSSSWKSIGRKLIAALWEEGRTFKGENLRLITPHLDRALRLQMRLNAAQLQADIISGALDHLTLGVILVDRAGIPIWHNRRAHEIMASAGGLRIARNGLAGA